MSQPMSTCPVYGALDCQVITSGEDGVDSPFVLGVASTLSFPFPRLYYFIFDCSPHLSRFSQKTKLVARKLFHHLPDHCFP